MRHIIFVTDIIVPGLQHIFMVGRKVFATTEKQIDTRIQYLSVDFQIVDNIIIGNVIALL